MVTMLLGGLWHGAGWTFVLWGALHGAYLAINHLWHEVKARFGPFAGESTRLGLLAAGAVTFLAVVVAWVPFRAADLTQAGDVLAGMIGLNGLEMPAALDAGSTYVAWGWIASLLALAWLAPNTQEIMARYLPQMRGAKGAADLLSWRLDVRYAALAAVAAIVALGHLGNVSEFIYFQF